jgi:hypothetical protein
MVDSGGAEGDHALWRGVDFSAVEAFEKDGERRVFDYEAAQGRRVGDASCGGRARGMRVGVSDFAGVKTVTRKRGQRLLEIISDLLRCEVSNLRTEISGYGFWNLVRGDSGDESRWKEGEIPRSARNDTSV